MVSHPVIIAATSPVVAPAPPPTTTIPPLMASLSMPPTPSSIISEPTKLHQLFDLGDRRFNLGDDIDDIDPQFADIYVRTLQVALRSSALRNQRMQRKLKSVRQANAKMRATKCEERVAAQRRADAAKQKQTIAKQQQQKHSLA